MAREHLLLPADNAFISLTIAIAFLLNVMPWGSARWVPDFLALVLFFWNVRQPRKVGMGVAFLFGLVMDVHQASLLGEHALGYSLLSYGAFALQRRLPWFDVGGQLFHVLPLFVAAQLATVLVRMALGGAFPGWSIFVAPAISALLWPVADLLLLAPQRRAVDRDQTRPL
ncbi:MAG: rod shape-determining protein MreD [Betaproteobacteria bacterium]|nr:rod shape-determining protein MreD [Betaproteobacteria bacterium]NBY17269.1 rod shape-determining protein MreD [Betaproteobacteria bacterium]